jgi:hypothetical protein
MTGKAPTLERTLADMQRWPSSWEIDGDRAAGETLVAALTPFVHHLYETGVAPPRCGGTSTTSGHWAARSSANNMKTTRPAAFRR